MLPTAGEISAFRSSVLFAEIAAEVATRRPDLGAVMQQRSGSLSLRLPALSHGPERRVVLGQFRHRSSLYWLVVGITQSNRSVQTVWAVDTPTEKLVDAMESTYDACCTGDILPSPWRWAETTQSDAVTVADKLVERGVEVEWVAAGNRTIPDEYGDWREPREIPQGWGPALEVMSPYGPLVLSRREDVGWVVDADDLEGTVWRVDVATALTGERSSYPGWETSLEALVDAIVHVCEQPAEYLLHPPTPPAGGGRDQLVETALRRLGFAGVHAPDDEDAEWRGPLRVVVHELRRSISHVKVTYADAISVGLTPVVLSVGGFTRDATAWANSVGMMLFNCTADYTHIRPASKTAERISFIGARTMRT